MPPIPLIAVVDDDAAVRAAVSDLLEVSRLEPQAFPNAEAFIKAYAPGRYGCVITDVRMDEMSGLDLLSRLQELEPKLPVILLTAESLATPDGAYAVLSKPADAAELVRQVLAAVRHDG